MQISTCFELNWKIEQKSQRRYWFDQLFHNVKISSNCQNVSCLGPKFQVKKILNEQQGLAGFLYLLSDHSMDV